MTLLVLAETSAGYALFKAKDKKLLKRESLAADTATAEGVCSLLRLKQFHKFDSAATALEEVTALVEGKVSPLLASLLDTVKDEKKASLAVADPKLGNAINKLPSISLKPISDSSTSDLYRAIRNHLTSLIPGLVPQDLSTMSLGLSHSLSRHKLKFSPDKVDTMIVQAIALLDDLDKELNAYAMRVKEWYGWHFPEMGKIVNDNVAYARVILKMGLRSNASKTDLSDVLPEEIEGAVKAAAEISMGTEITTEDVNNILALAEQVVSFTEYRQQLSSYLSARMTAIAPNLTTLVGELVGARLIAHAGSLINLAKSPASTIQILGAEKALFRALKTKHDTPKYGLIYHASLIGQATGKNKGKIARMVATKAAIGLRVDALSDWGTHNEGNADDVPEEEKAAIGIESRAKIERRLRTLEGKPLQPKAVTIGPNGKMSNQPGKWEVKEARKYNPDADGLLGNEPAAADVTSQSTLAPDIKPSNAIQNGDVKMIEEIEGDETSLTVNGDEDNEDMENADGKQDDGKDLKGDRHEVDEDEDEMDQDEEDREDDEDDEEEEDDEDDEDDEDEEVEKTPVPVATPAAPGPPPVIPDIAMNGETQMTEESQPESSFLSLHEPGDPGIEDPEGPPAEVAPPIDPKKAAKKARKAERKAARAAHIAQKAAEREVKMAKRLARQERRQAKREAAVTPEDIAKFSELSEKVGLSVVTYKHKLAQGEIIFNVDGNPMALSKKELKQRKKAARMAIKKKMRQERKVAKAIKRQGKELAKQERQLKRKRPVEGGLPGEGQGARPATDERQESKIAEQAIEGNDRKRRKTEENGEQQPARPIQQEPPKTAEANTVEVKAKEAEGAAEDGAKRKKRKRDDANGEMKPSGSEEKKKKKKKKSKE